MQTFSPPTVLKHLLRAADWRLTMRDDRCEIVAGESSTTIPCLAIEKARIGGWVFSTLSITAEGRPPLRLKWLVSGGKFKRVLADNTRRLLAQAERAFLAGMRDFYIANHDFQTWRDSMPGEHKRFFAGARKRLRNI